MAAQTGHDARPHRPDRHSPARAILPPRRPTLAGLRVEAVNDLGLASDASVLRYSTPHRFKGLEADVVLLCDLDGNPMPCASRNLYVAASRAKNRLYVLQTER